MRTGMADVVKRGLAAGAAGTTALNAVTYADMVLRGRPASEMPQKAVETLASKTGTEIPGEGETRSNRVSALGSLSGLGAGLAIGVAAAFLGPAVHRLPIIASGLLLGGAAMAATDGSMVQLGLTDPKSWSATDWASDAVPHAAYGFVAAWTLRRLAAGKRAEKKVHKQLDEAD